MLPLERRDPDHAGRGNAKGSGQTSQGSPCSVCDLLDQDPRPADWDSLVAVLFERRAARNLEVARRLCARIVTKRVARGIERDLDPDEWLDLLGGLTDDLESAWAPARPCSEREVAA